MRRIKSQLEAEKTTRRKQIIVGVVLIGLLVLSTLGYSLLSGSGDEDNQDNVNYGGLEFERQGSFWRLSVGEVGNIQEFYFTYLPQEVTGVSVSNTKSLQSYSGDALYFVNKDNNEQAVLGMQETLNNLGRYILRYQEACFDIDCTNKDLPIKNCDGEDNLIVFTNNNQTRVWEEGNCVYISGDFVMGVDGFLYDLFGII